jgi:hypothetical protein
MSEATAKYWAARCRRGTPPGPGSPCAALLWATDEIERLRAIEKAAHSALYDRPSASGRDELRRLVPKEDR